MSTLSLCIISILVAAAVGPAREPLIAVQPVEDVSEVAYDEAELVEDEIDDSDVILADDVVVEEVPADEVPADEVFGDETGNDDTVIEEPPVDESGTDAAASNAPSPRPIAAALTAGEIFERGDFRILHAGAKTAAEQVAHELATLQAEFGVWLESMGTKPKSPRAPLLVMLVTPEELHALRAKFGLPADTRGFYRREENMAVFPTPEDRLTAMQRRVIRHEGLHLLQFNSGVFDREADDLSLWLVEGIAVRFENSGGDLCADPVRVEEFFRKYPSPQTLPNVRGMLQSNTLWDHARDQVVAGMLIRWLERESPEILQRALMIMRQGDWRGDWLDVFAAREVRITDRFKQTLFDAVRDCEKLAAQGE